MMRCIDATPGAPMRDVDARPSISSAPMTMHE
jgi:hypothetical protein